MKILTDLSAAIKVTFADRRYFALFVILFALFFLVFFYIPIVIVPGNSFGFQISLFGMRDWLVVLIIAGANSLFITMQMYFLKMKKLLGGSKLGTIGSFAASGAGTASGFLASIFGTATCFLCVTAIFSFFSANFLFFMLEYRSLITLSAIGLLLMALVMTSRRLSSACEACRVDIG